MNTIGKVRLNSHRNLGKDKSAFVYYAFGLNIKSQIDIPELEPSPVFDNNIDLEIKFLVDKTPEDCLPSEVLSETMALQADSKRALLYIRDTGAFIVEQGRKITIIPQRKASLVKIRQTVIGKAIAILLCQRKNLVLHGSAVAINKSVAIFLGNSGDGKSTTAATLHSLGHQLITDDVAAVDLSQSAITYPTYPQVKLAETTGSALGYECIGKLDSPLNKSWYRFQKNIPQQPFPVGAIYILAKSDRFKIEPLAPQQALTVLMQHSSHNLLFHQQETHHFLQCATLARRVPVYRLQRPFDLDLLPQLGKSLEEHFSSQLSI